jgi:nucleoid-associated protein YgaU
MNQQPVKVAVIFGVLVIAIIAMLTFKKKPEQSTQTATAGTRVTAHKLPVDVSAFDERLSKLTGKIENAPAAMPVSTTREAVDFDAPTPQLPDTFSREPLLHDTQPAPLADADADQSPAQEDGPRKHRVRDGDTLASLAERFLGDAKRADELLAANRERISDPELLPIGVELVIPAAEVAAETENEEDLVPIAPRKSAKR